MTSTLPTEPPLADMTYCYGLWVTSVGEEGGLLVAGHQPLRQAIAAMDHYSRTVLGLKDLTDGDGTTFAELESVIEHLWATSSTPADCPTRVPDFNAGLRHNCEMCSALDDGNWWITVHETEQPGSFPVTWMST